MPAKRCFPYLTALHEPLPSPDVIVVRARLSSPRPNNMPCGVPAAPLRGLEFLELEQHILLSGRWFAKLTTKTMRNTSFVTPLSVSLSEKWSG